MFFLRHDCMLMRMMVAKSCVTEFCLKQRWCPHALSVLAHFSSLWKRGARPCTTFPGPGGSRAVSLQFSFIELSRYFNSLSFHSFKSARGLSVQINLCLCLYLNCFIVDIPKHTIQYTKGHHVNLQTFVCWYYCFTSLF